MVGIDELVECLDIVAVYLAGEHRLRVRELLLGGGMPPVNQ